MDLDTKFAIYLLPVGWNIGENNKLWGLFFKCCKFEKWARNQKYIDEDLFNTVSEPYLTTQTILSGTD